MARRRKSIKDLNEQYNRIGRGITYERNSLLLNGGSRERLKTLRNRLNRSIDAVERYTGNIEDKQQKRNITRRYSQRTYMGLSKG